MGRDRREILPHIEDWMPRYFTIQLERCHPRLLEWQGAETTRAILERSLKAELSWLGNEAVLERYAAACRMDGASPADYGIRFLEFEGLGSLLAGIHFYGMDGTRPFVHASAMDFELEMSSVVRFGRLLQDEFEVFGAERFRIWIDSEDAPLTASPGSEIDQWVLAGSLGEIQKSELPANSSRISMVADPELETFSAFEKCYRDYLDANPGMDTWLSIGEREHFEACAKEAANYRVHIDGEPAGWIAGKRDESGAVGGWQMIDELLEARFRGQGLAAAMQRAFLDTLPSGDLIWGTIDARNIPSLRTAQRAGREIVGGYLFLPVP